MTEETITNSFVKSKLIDSNLKNQHVDNDELQLNLDHLDNIEVSHAYADDLEEKLIDESELEMNE